ncbi:MAG: glycosyltransferase [Sulfuricella sp.]|nr:glycosyltransferase [Sulfuricella sp.]
MPPTRIGFVLLSNSANPMPSTRIAVLNMFPYLRASGYEPVIAFEPKQNTEQPDVSGLAERLSRQNINIAFFQKVHGPSVLGEMKKLSAAGIRTVYGVCDLIDDDIAAAADATIVVTDYLKSLYHPALRHKIHVVHDGIENPDFVKPLSSNGGRALGAVLVTSGEIYEIPVIRRPPGFVGITVVGRYPPAPSLRQRIAQAYWKVRSKAGYPEKYRYIRSLLDKGFRTVNWNIDTVYQEMARADIGIIPVDMRPDPLPGRNVSWWQVKSENRLTMKMALGLPVIASPVPSYANVIEQGKNGFIATTRADWFRCLDALRDPRLRQAMGQNARDSVLRRFSKEEQGRRLVRVLDGLSLSGASGLSCFSQPSSPPGEGVDRRFTG